MSWLGLFYQRFWYFTEFWLTPVNRRPYTFIIRDFIYSHSGLSIAIISVWFSLVFVFNLYHPVPASLIFIFSAFLLGHLIWGTKYIEQQQEWPTYLGE